MTAQARRPLFLVLSAASLIIWWRPLIETIKLASNTASYTHILLIVPLSVALIYTDTRFPAADARPNLASGSMLLAFAFGLGAYARWATGSFTDLERLVLLMLALVLWWNASVAACFGWRIVRLFAFPLCLLFLVVPVPEFILDRAIDFLQLESAAAARIMFRMIGVPAVQDGIIISIPGLDLEVAQECSSIRSSVFLVVIALVLAYLFLRSWWRRAIVIAATVPLSVAKNGLRIVTIGELGTRVDPSYLTGRLHHHGGPIFLAVALLVLGVFLWILRKSELTRPQPS